jgi:hypothetical protein
LLVAVPPDNAAPPREPKRCGGWEHRLGLCLLLIDIKRLIKLSQCTVIDS